MLLEEIIAVSCENRTEYIAVNVLRGEDLLDVKAGGTYCYRCILKA
jgi:hypothetical protein